MALNTRDILNDVERNNKIAADAVTAAYQAAVKRINGQSDNNKFEADMTEIRKNLAVQKENEKKLAILKAATQGNLNKNDQSNQTSV